MFSINLSKGKTILKNKVAGSAQEALNALIADYPTEERLTFDKQEAEARAWTANNSTPTPMLSSIAAARGQTVEDLAPVVIAKADALTSQSGTVLGKRRAIETLIESQVEGTDLKSLDITL